MNDKLGIKFRGTPDGGQVRVTFGNKGIDIYNALTTKDGVEFQPVTPWSGQPIPAASKDPKAAWREVRKRVEDKVWSAFGSATIDAKRVGTLLGIFTR